jgi:hypothetical protein
LSRARRDSISLDPSPALEFGSTLLLRMLAAAMVLASGAAAQFRSPAADPMSPTGGIYGNVARPVVTKLGTSDIEACETTPVVLPTGRPDVNHTGTVEELHRFECVHGVVKGDGSPITEASWSNIDPDLRPCVATLLSSRSVSDCLCQLSHLTAWLPPAAPTGAHQVPALHQPPHRRPVGAVWLRSHPRERLLRGGDEDHVRIRHEPHRHARYCQRFLLNGR